MPHKERRTQPCASSLQTNEMHVAVWFVATHFHVCYLFFLARCRSFRSRSCNCLLLASCSLQMYLFPVMAYADMSAALRLFSTKGYESAHSTAVPPASLSFLDIFHDLGGHVVRARQGSPGLRIFWVSVPAALPACVAGQSCIFLCCCGRRRSS